MGGGGGVVILLVFSCLAFFDGQVFHPGGEGGYTFSFIKTSNFAAEVEPKLNVLLLIFETF